MSAQPMDLGPIGRVSPLIKTARWSLLLLGVWWGHKRYAANKATEDEIRNYNLRMQPIWDAEKAALKAKASREELITLAHATGVPVKPDF